MRVIRSLPRILLAIALPAACAQRAGRVQDGPPPPPPPPPQVIAPPRPPVVDDSRRDLLVCVLENGTLKLVRADYDTRSGDTLVGGRRFAEVYPTTAGYAEGTTWYVNNEAITVNGRRLVKYGLPRVLGVDEITRAGEYRGVPLFQEAGVDDPLVLYAPVRRGCEFQPYEASLKSGGVRGE